MKEQATRLPPKIVVYRDFNMLNETASLKMQN